MHFSFVTNCSLPSNFGDLQDARSNKFCRIVCATDLRKSGVSPFLSLAPCNFTVINCFLSGCAVKRINKCISKIMNKCISKSINKCISKGMNK